MERFVSPLLGLFTSFSAATSDTVARPQWQKHFDARNMRGTFVLLEPAKDRCLAMNFTPTKDIRYEDRFTLTRAILDEAGALPSGSPPS